MNVFSRVIDIVNANIHALLDSVEDPKKLIKLMIKKIDETQLKYKRHFAQLHIEQKAIMKQIMNEQGKIEDWQAKAELAITHNREDLAKAALMEKQKLTVKIDHLSSISSSMGEQLASLKKEMQQLQEKLIDAKTIEKKMLMTEQMNKVPDPIHPQMKNKKIGNFMNKLDEYEYQINHIETKALALGYIADNNIKSQNDEFSELRADDFINKELLALQKEQKKKTLND